MAQIVLGGLAFAAAFVFDLASWLRIPYLKALSGFASIAMFGAALVWTLATPGRLGWPAWTPLVGWPLLLLATALLAYSLFVEIPFAATYTGKGASGTLVKSGTYALVRHPGVLWFGLLMLAGVLVSRARLMLLAGVTWTALDAVYVWLQELLVFRKTFPGYAAYQLETPMLVPTPRSAARCLRTLQVCHRRPT